MYSDIFGIFGSKSDHSHSRHRDAGGPCWPDGSGSPAGCRGAGERCGRVEGPALLRAATRTGPTANSLCLMSRWQSMVTAGGATATATVGANGAVTDLTITNPGSGYTAATVGHSLAAGNGAAADATVNAGGSVTSITVDAGGSGYTAPVVTISGGGATTDATADRLRRRRRHDVGWQPGSRLHDADGQHRLPRHSGRPRRRPATADHVRGPDPDCQPANNDRHGHQSGIVVDNPGSGYSTAPHVRHPRRHVVRPDPRRHDQPPRIGHPRPSRPSSSTRSAPATRQLPTRDHHRLRRRHRARAPRATATTDTGAVTALNLDRRWLRLHHRRASRSSSTPLPGLCTPPACPTDRQVHPARRSRRPRTTTASRPTST